MRKTASYGKTNIKNEKEAATRLGGIVSTNLAFSGRKLAQVKLPSVYAIPPKYIIWDMVVFSILVPGTGLWQRLNREYFCAQYMLNSPMMAIRGIMGWSET